MNCLPDLLRILLHAPRHLMYIWKYGGYWMVYEHTTTNTWFKALLVSYQGNHHDTYIDEGFISHSHYKLAYKKKTTRYIFKRQDENSHLEIKRKTFQSWDWCHTLNDNNPHKNNQCRSNIWNCKHPSDISDLNGIWMRFTKMLMVSFVRRVEGKAWSRRNYFSS